MRFDDIQWEALKNRELVYAMDQGLVTFDESTMPKSWVEAGASGRCVGFALRWIGLRAWGRDYHHSVTSTGRGGSASWATDSFAEVPRDQAVSRANTSGFLLRIEEVLKAYTVTINRALYMRTTQSITAPLVMDRVFAGDGLYYFELRRDGGAHAIAVQRIGNQYRLFDANEGHFVLNGRTRFAEFLEKFLADTGYAKRYVVGTWVAGVTAIPPIPTNLPCKPLRPALGVRGGLSYGHRSHTLQTELLGRRAVR
jgi:hypothetical protein